MRFAFIEDHRATWPIAIQCRVLAVSRSGYYEWRRRPVSERAQRRASLTAQIRKFHVGHHASYGSPRVFRELRARGDKVNEKTVAKVMREAGIQAKSHRKFRVTTTDSNHTQPVAENTLNREFTTEKRNQKWVADITYITTLEGWLYLAAAIDLFTRKVVGWSMSERIDSRLVVDALEMAVSRELPAPSGLAGAGLVAHSDRGVQYASEHYQGVLTQHDIECSMSRKGNCWDNAPAESFFATLKKELVHHEDYETREAARASLFDYIEVFYNRERRHSALGYVSPVAFEEAA
jgi:transposase InsO family protein